MSFTIQRGALKNQQFFKAEGEVREFLEFASGTQIDPERVQETLKDGVLLCNVMLKLKPGIIKSPQISKFDLKQADNVREFIRGAKLYGCKSNFEANELIKSQNLLNVYLFINELAKLASKNKFDPNKSPSEQQSEPVKIEEKKTPDPIRVEHRKSIDPFRPSSPSKKIEEKKIAPPQVKVEEKKKVDLDLVLDDFQIPTDIENDREMVPFSLDIPDEGNDLFNKHKESQEKEKLEKEKAEKQRLEKERLEKERLEKEKIEKEKLEKQRIEKERLEKEKIEKEKIEKERLEKEKLEKQRLEKERLEKERIEKERIEKENAEKQRIEKRKN